jgi:hypothetical protein
MCTPVVQHLTTFLVLCPFKTRPYRAVAGGARTERPRYGWYCRRYEAACFFEHPARSAGCTGMVAGASRSGVGRVLSQVCRPDGRRSQA